MKCWTFLQLHSIPSFHEKKQQQTNKLKLSLCSLALHYWMKSSCRRDCKKLSAHLASYAQGLYKAFPSHSYYWYIGSHLTFFSIALPGVRWLKFTSTEGKVVRANERQATDTQSITLCLCRWQLKARARKKKTDKATNQLFKQNKTKPNA